MSIVASSYPVYLQIRVQPFILKGLFIGEVEQKGKRFNQICLKSFSTFSKFILSVQWPTFLIDLRCILEKPDICLKNVGGNVANRIICEGFVKHIQRTASITEIINWGREDKKKLQDQEQHRFSPLRIALALANDNPLFQNIHTNGKKFFFIWSTFLDKSIMFQLQEYLVYDFSSLKITLLTLVKRLKCGGLMRNGGSVSTIGKVYTEHWREIVCLKCKNPKTSLWLANVQKKDAAFFTIKAYDQLPDFLAAMIEQHRSLLVVRGLWDLKW